MATWPSTLPKPNLAGYTVQAADQVVRTDMEGGAARVRRRTTSAPDKITLSFVFTDAQMVIFRSFWVTDFLSGAAWVFVPIKDGIATGTTSKECRPADGTFKATPTGGGLWVVEMNVEVRSA